MPIDKELYKNAYLQYQQWNAAKDKRRNIQSESTQAWQQYIDLVELCWQLSPQRSPKQRVQKLAALDQYYTKVQKLEEWRKANARQN